MKFNLKRGAAALLMGLAIIGSASACSALDNSTSTPPAQNAASHEAQAQGQDMQNLITNQPVHVYQFSQERATLQAVEDIQANGENTTSFGFSNDGKLMWHCSSIGMPVAASTEITNPHQIIQDPFGGGYNLNNGGQVVDQADPTGVYTGASTGTNTLCAGPKGDYIQYWEGYVDAVSGPATWVPGQGVQLLGTPDKINVQTSASK